MDYLKELNPSQYEAVTATNGPVMIIAGPGSGKTRVLTYRIAYMINVGSKYFNQDGDEVQKPIDPFNILALTFTNKAAKEMRERIWRIVGNEARNVMMGTFHSVFARILRIEAEKIGYPQNFTIYDTQDSKNLIKNLVKEMNLNDKLYKPNIIYNRISSAKNSLISPTGYMQDPYLVSEDESSGRPKMAELYMKYTKRCFMAGAMDFDDLLYKMWVLLEGHPDVLYKYQQVFKYIMIDEYQDTNYAQYMVTKKLAAAYENICVVGDDAQSIYSFRGADIQNILNFEKDYPDFRVFKLEQNYRSTEHIVEAANEIIHNNKNQLAKEIFTEKGEGKKIKVVKTLSDNDEGKWIADHIFSTKMTEQLRNSDFAILYRTNAQSRSFEEALRKRGIAYKVYGGLSFYQRKEIKDLLAYLKLTMNHHDEEALRRIVNYPTRGIGQTTIEKATVIAAQEEKPLWEILCNARQYGAFNNRASGLLVDFTNMIKSFAAMQYDRDAFDLAMHVAKSTTILKELYNDKSVEGLSRYENIQELLNSIKEYTDDDEVEQDENAEELLANDKSLASYLQNVVLLTNADDEKGDQDWVSLMTIHAAKGLEFPAVYVVGLEENLFPSMMATASRTDLEEERRLYYVAVTRAEQQLVLSWAATRYRFGNLQYNEKSRFLDEISEKHLDHEGRQAEAKPTKQNWGDFNRFKKKLDSIPTKPLGAGFSRNLTKVSKTEQSIPSFAGDDVSGLQVGMQIDHQKFGTGKVISIEGAGDNRIATVFFNGIGNKRIMLKYAKVKVHRSV